MNDEQHKDIGKLRPQYQTYDRQKCFIAYSEQADWSADLLSACEQVLSKPEFNLEPDYARRHFVSDVPLRQKALELIANARYGIYDLSCWRTDDKSLWQMPRNVFIELGIAIALNRPTLLLRHASNKEAGLELPNCLKFLGEQILEFSGNHSLERVLLEKLPKWVSTAPEKAWWNHRCILGDRICEHRETHPRAKQFGQNTLNCIIADGADSSRPDFREIVEDVLGRFSDVTYTYLDALSLEKGYSFLLCTHCQKVRSSPLAIHRITLKTPPEAFIAIGMSIALETQFEYKIPKILITEDVQIVPSLLSGYEVVIAKSDKDKKDNLRKFMPTVIKKVRETTWKPKPLPFLDISVSITNEDELKAGLSPLGVPLNQAVVATQVRYPTGNELKVELIKAAENKGGSLTVTQGVKATGASFVEVEASFKEMLKSGYVRIDNDFDTGAVTYNITNSDELKASLSSDVSLDVSLNPAVVIELIKAAENKGGSLTVTQGVKATGASFAEVEASLKEMLKSGYVRIDNDHITGAVTYHFREL